MGNKPILECAPMQGVLDYTWRRAQARHFTPADRYYTPFLSPTSVPGFSSKELREILPANNAGLNVVPQLLGHNGADLVRVIRELRDMGYKEVNLNLGCPSGTVVKKKKGSGLLGDTVLLKRTLDTVFDFSPLPVSVKTRIGVRSAEEFPQLLELFGQYPIRELIVHPRTGSQQYRGTADRTAWRYTLEHTTLPLCYNGDLFSAAEANAFLRDYPETGSIMLGRGSAANPKLFGELSGEAPLQSDELRDFFFDLYEELHTLIPQERYLLLHIKELWFYLGNCFDGGEKLLKAIRKAQTAQELLCAADRLFTDVPLKQNAGYSPAESF